MGRKYFINLFHVLRGVDLNKIIKTRLISIVSKPIEIVVVVVVFVQKH